MLAFNFPFIVIVNLKTKKKKEINPNVLRALGIEVLVDKKYKKQVEKRLNDHFLKKNKEGYFN